MLYTSPYGDYCYQKNNNLIIPLKIHIFFNKIINKVLIHLTKNNIKDKLYQNMIKFSFITIIIMK